jgi:hypothetical protein
MTLTYNHGLLSADTTRTRSSWTRPRQADGPQDKMPGEMDLSWIGLSRMSD